MAQLALTVLLLLNICAYCEMSVYAGLRRRPTTLNDALHQKLEQQYELPSDYLSQLMEENARRRLQQQFEHQLSLINKQMQRQREEQRNEQRYRQLQELRNDPDDVPDLDQEQEAYDSDDDQYGQYNEKPAIEFGYKYLTNELDESDENNDGDNIPFAVAPNDPRFYAEQNDHKLDTQAMSDYEEYLPAASNPVVYELTAAPPISGAAGFTTVTAAVEATVRTPVQPAQAPAPLQTAKLPVHNNSTATTATFHRIKPQMAAAAAAVVGVKADVTPMKPVQNDAQAFANTRHDISAMIERLQKQIKSETISRGQHAPPALSGEAGNVVRQHLGMEGEMGVYVVALIAGISAAITVGLIVLVIAWYTLRNRAKAAADVEYPAYGVTGPNKEVSPSGDRKLAQCAQMYHYQHQKQQIIAMENRQAAEGNLSDVDSDDDNEEGDYTVYECPGLAPTCEMEVKNPLFLDETPVTPAGAAAVVNNIPPTTTNQQQSNRTVTAIAASSKASEDKKKKKNKK